MAIHADQVDWDASTITVHRVVTRHGGLREWPKTRESNRTLPLPGHLRDGLWRLAADGPPNSLLFPAPEGGFLSDSNFRNRIWYPAIVSIGACPAHATRPPGVGLREHHEVMAACSACRPVPYYPPRVLRHTAASLLLRAGVPKDQVKALLGHSRETTTDIYAQFAPGELPAVQSAWSQRAGDARLTHRDDGAPSLEGEGAEESLT